MSKKEKGLHLKFVCSQKKCYYTECQNFTSHRFLIGTALYKTMSFLKGIPEFYLALGAIFARSNAVYVHCINAHVSYK